MSNLLQKASIVTTPTAYGVGVLNSIKPAYALGENLVVNGTFDTDSDWTKGTGWTISGGKANSDGSQTGTSNLFQNMGILSNKSVKVEYTISNYSAGHLDLSFFGTGLPASETRANANGNYIWYVNIPTGHNGNVGFSANSSFVGSVDNFSVKVETEADFDFTRNSSATRVNPDYLIQDVSILSSNLVQNGNFSELGAEEITNGDFSVDGTLTTSSYTLGWYSPDSGISISDGKLIITNGASIGGRAYGTNGVNGISFLTSGKSYKLVYTIEENNDNALVFYHNGGSYVAAPNTVGTHTIYYQAGGTIFILRNNTANATIKIDNVSVKQVDPNDNWILGTGWSFGEDKVSAVSTSVTTYQISNIVSGKKYLLKWEITDYTAGLFAMAAGGNIIDYWKSANGIYSQTVIAGSSGTIDLRCAGFTGSVSNISVIEIQQTDIPRLDYTNGTASILLEPQSTNLQTKSNEFSTWTLASNVTRTADYTLSPEGVSNATRLQFTSNGYLANGTITSGTQYTVSVYAKRNDTGTQSFGFFVDGSGAVNSEMLLTSEWKRFSFTHTATNGSFVGLAGLSGADVSVYGMQLETLTYPTSYIPTSGSTVTRAAETLNNAGNSDLINSTEGVLYAEIAALSDDLTFRTITLSDGTTSNNVGFGYRNNSNVIYTFLQGVVNSSSVVTVSNITDFNKVAIKYKSGNFAMWVNGVEVYTNAGTFTLNGLSEVSFDNGGGAADFYGKCKTVAVFKEALSDTELACLTSTNNREIFLNYYYRMQYVEANTEALSCAEQTFNI